jgi:hypothetical protein
MTELSDSFAASTSAWLANKAVTDVGLKSLNASRPNAAPASDISEIKILFQTLNARPLNRTTWQAKVDRLRVLLDQDQAPPEVKALFYYRTAASPGGWAGQAASVEITNLANAAKVVEADPAGQRSAAWLRTEMAIDLENAHNFAAAQTALEAVVALPESALPEDDDIRHVAAAHLAMTKARLDRQRAAETLASDSSAPPTRCSMLDIKPVATNRSISDSTFPIEALRWRFEGYVREAFDIGRDGKVDHVRTVIAYPPFVFDHATENAVSHFRFLPPLGADGAYVGCTNHMQTVIYDLGSSSR